MLPRLVALRIAQKMEILRLDRAFPGRHCLGGPVRVIPTLATTPAIHRERVAHLVDELAGLCFVARLGRDAAWVEAGIRRTGHHAGFLLSDPA